MAKAKLMKQLFKLCSFVIYIAKLAFATFAKSHVIKLTNISMLATTIHVFSSETGLYIVFSWLDN